MRTLLSLSLLLIALVGCGPSGAPVVTTPTAAQVAEFTKNASITLPASAQPVGWREQRGMDDALWLQVKLPSGDVQGLLDGSPFRGATLTADHPSVLTPFRDFVPKPPVRYRGAQQLLPNARFLTILIDDTDPAQAVVYLMWNET